MGRTEKTAEGQVISSWQEIVRLLNRENPTKLDPSAESFTEYAWDRFDARHVLDLLLSKEPSYHGHKEVLFAGFCAWVVVTSQRQDIVQDSMALQTLKIIKDEESNVPKMLQAYPVLVDFYIRLIRIGSDFFQDIYYPIGGIGRLISSPSVGSLEESLKSRVSGIRSVITIMEITHYHIAELKHTGKHRPPSFNAAFTIIDSLSEAQKDKKTDTEKPKPKIHLRRRSLINHRDYYEGQICLLYAASSIKVMPDRSLLDCILEGVATWEEHGHLLPEWIARAKFANQVILSEIATVDVVQANAVYLPKMEQSPIPVPNLPAAMIEKIREKYRR
ncbi:hypothetical protein KBI52_10335 [Microvirga sp. HBU67558]|uniref:hypothetical protein n=1 Tax=Microvirga TaxID=186650 RepID=UPI001B36C5A5|nr:MULTISPECIES: hypothetical protein [unclassified Microvirga]MBQ0820601.1 hypothetical protein [Microvirga sp. HBU67558]